MSAFKTALAAGDRRGLRACPKSDLHNHFYLGGDRGFIAARTGRDIAPLAATLTSMAQMHAWVDGAIGSTFSGSAGRFLAFEANWVQAAKDGVTRLEIGEDVWALNVHPLSAAALTRRLTDLHQSTAPDVAWIPQLGLSRHCALSDLQRWLEPFLDLGFYRTVDLSGDEFAQPIQVFKSLYRQAKAAGLRLKAHVGEWGGADDVWRAVETLELDEVQHGVAAAASEHCLRFLADHRIRVNVCPTSNVRLGRVDSIKSHPIRRLYDAGVKVTINTDDVLVFGQSVSDEFLALYQAEVFTADELDEIRLNGLTDL